MAQKQNKTNNTVEQNDLDKVKDAGATAKNKINAVAAGEYYKKTKVKFLTLICGDFGTYMPGETGEIALANAKELERLGKCEILKD